MILLTLISEWPSPSSFFNFLASPSFAEFKTDLKPYIVSPPELKLYETNIGMEPLLKDLNVEVLMIRAKDTTDPEALFSLSEKVASGVKQTNGAYIIHGSSINPENKEILVFGAYNDKSESVEKREFVESMRKVSDLTQLVAEVTRTTF